MTTEKKQEEQLKNGKNPCALVRTTCRRWMESEPTSSSWENTSNNDGRRSVKIHKEHLPRLAKDIWMKQKNQSSDENKSSSSSSSNTKDWIEWDDDNWHYSGENFKGSKSQKMERIALYILALDAINFCFWPPKPGNNNTNSTINPMEYEQIATGLKKLAEIDDDDHNTIQSESLSPNDDNKNGENNNNDDVKYNTTSKSYAFSPTNLATMTAEQMEELLRPHLDGHYFHNISKRSILWNEIGNGLIKHFNGSAMKFISSAENSAPKLVELLMLYFPGFRDVCYFNDNNSIEKNKSNNEQNENEFMINDESNKIYFLKRAQIFVGDINAALNLGLQQMDQLTTFADYRVPQILRHFDILEYSPTLCNIVDTQEEIMASSYDEISIRAATVTAVDDLVEFLNNNIDNPNKEQTSKNNSKLDETTTKKETAITTYTAVTVDWYLWQVGERMHQEGKMKPFHKVRTSFY